MYIHTMEEPAAVFKKIDLYVETQRELKIIRINEKNTLQTYTQHGSVYVHFQVLCIGYRCTQMWQRIKIRTERIYAYLGRVYTSEQKRKSNERKSLIATCHMFFFEKRSELKWQMLNI